MKGNSLVSEIKRQLTLKSEITSIGPPHVVLNGEEVLAELERLQAKLTAVGKALDPHYSGGDVEVLAKRVVANYDELEDKLYPGSV